MDSVLQFIHQRATTRAQWEAPLDAYLRVTSVPAPAPLVFDTVHKAAAPAVSKVKTTPPAAPAAPAVPSTPKVTATPTAGATPPVPKAPGAPKAPTLGGVRHTWATLTPVHATDPSRSMAPVHVALGATPGHAAHNRVIAGPSELHGAHIGSLIKGMPATHTLNLQLHNEGTVPAGATQQHQYAEADPTKPLPKPAASTAGDALFAASAMNGQTHTPAPTTPPAPKIKPVTASTNPASFTPLPHKGEPNATAVAAVNLSNMSRAQRQPNLPNAAPPDFTVHPNRGTVLPGQQPVDIPRTKQEELWRKADYEALAHSPESRKALTPFLDRDGSLKRSAGYADRAHVRKILDGLPSMVAREQNPVWFHAEMSRLKNFLQQEADSERPYRINSGATRSTMSPMSFAHAHAIVEHYEKHGTLPHWWNEYKSPLVRLTPHAVEPAPPPDEAHFLRAPITPGTAAEAEKRGGQLPAGTPPSQLGPISMPGEPEEQEPETAPAALGANPAASSLSAASTGASSLPPPAVPTPPITNPAPLSSSPATGSPSAPPAFRQPLPLSAFSSPVPGGQAAATPAPPAPNPNDLRGTRFAGRLNPHTGAPSQPAAPVTPPDFHAPATADAATLAQHQQQLYQHVTALRQEVMNNPQAPDIDEKRQRLAAMAGAYNSTGKRLQTALQAQRAASMAPPPAGAGTPAPIPPATNLGSVNPATVGPDAGTVPKPPAPNLQGAIAAAQQNQPPPIEPPPPDIPPPTAPVTPPTTPTAPEQTPTAPEQPPATPNQEHIRGVPQRAKTRAARQAPAAAAPPEQAPTPPPEQSVTTSSAPGNTSDQTAAPNVPPPTSGTPESLTETGEPFVPEGESQPPAAAPEQQPAAPEQQPAAPEQQPTPLSRSYTPADNVAAPSAPSTAVAGSPLANQAPAQAPAATTLGQENRRLVDAVRKATTDEERRARARELSQFQVATGYDPANDIGSPQSREHEPYTPGAAAQQPATETQQPAAPTGIEGSPARNVQEAKGRGTRRAAAQKQQPVAQNEQQVAPASENQPTAPQVTQPETAAPETGQAAPTEPAPTGGAAGATVPKERTRKKKPAVEAPPPFDHDTWVKEHQRYAAMGNLPAGEVPDDRPPWAPAPANATPEELRMHYLAHHRAQTRLTQYHNTLTLGNQDPRSPAIRAAIERHQQLRDESQKRMGLGVRQDPGLKDESPLTAEDKDLIDYWLSKGELQGEKTKADQRRKALELQAAEAKQVRSGEDTRTRNRAMPDTLPEPDYPMPEPSKVDNPAAHTETLDPELFHHYTQAWAADLARRHSAQAAWHDNQNKNDLFPEIPSDHAQQATRHYRAANNLLNHIGAVDETADALHGSDGQEWVPPSGAGGNPAADAAKRRRGAAAIFGRNKWLDTVQSAEYAKNQHYSTADKGEPDLSHAPEEALPSPLHPTKGVAGGLNDEQMLWYLNRVRKNPRLNDALLSDLGETYVRSLNQEAGRPDFDPYWGAEADRHEEAARSKARKEYLNQIKYLHADHPHATPAELLKAWHDQVGPRAENYSRMQGGHKVQISDKLDSAALKLAPRHPANMKKIHAALQALGETVPTAEATPIRHAALHQLGEVQKRMLAIAHDEPGAAEWLSQEKHPHLKTLENFVHTHFPGHSRQLFLRHAVDHLDQQYPAAPRLRKGTEPAPRLKPSAPSFPEAKTVQEAAKKLGHLKTAIGQLLGTQAHGQRLALEQEIAHYEREYDRLKGDRPRDRVLADTAPVKEKPPAEAPTPPASSPTTGFKRTPNPEILKHAQEYNAAHGLPPIEEGHYAPVNEARAKEIGRAYEDLPANDSKNPEVKRAYAAFKNEIDQQWNHATGPMGIHMEPWTKPGQPYKDSKEMQADVRDNKHLHFFVGGEPHPLLKGKDKKTGLPYNHKFRAIHDLFGHAAEGYGFGQRGEENAWIKHSQMFSPEAQKAMTTETRGQNSWTNSGPHRFDKEGKEIPVAAADRPYAPQKVALMSPEHRDWRAALQAPPPPEPAKPSKKGTGKGKDAPLITDLPAPKAKKTQAEYMAESKERTLAARKEKGKAAAQTRDAENFARFQKNHGGTREDFDRVTAEAKERAVQYEHRRNGEVRRSLAHPEVIAEAKKTTPNPTQEDLTRARNRIERKEAKTPAAPAPGTPIQAELPGLIDHTQGKQETPKPGGAEALPEKTDSAPAKSAGHVAFHDGREYFEVDGQLHSAPIESPVHPNYGWRDQSRINRTSRPEDTKYAKLAIQQRAGLAPAPDTSFPAPAKDREGLDHQYEAAEKKLSQLESREDSFKADLEKNEPGNGRYFAHLPDADEAQKLTVEGVRHAHAALQAEKEALYAHMEHLQQAKETLPKEAPPQTHPEPPVAAPHQDHVDNVLKAYPRMEDLQEGLRQAQEHNLSSLPIMQEAYRQRAAATAKETPPTGRTVLPHLSPQEREARVVSRAADKYATPRDALNDLIELKKKARKDPEAYQEMVDRMEKVHEQVALRHAQTQQPATPSGDADTGDRPTSLGFQPKIDPEMVRAIAREILQEQQRKQT